MKVAVYYDWLNQWGGAERVLQDILEIYPKADLYTLCYRASESSWLPPHHVIHSLNLQNKLLYTPFFAPSLEQIDFSQYDLVISTTSTVGHCLLTAPHTLFICYFHNINRYLYQNPPFLLKPFLYQYRKIDQIYATRPDYLFCNSQNVAQRIWRYYHRLAKVIPPGIDTRKFIPISDPSLNYFLVVSRLVPHKKIDLLINTFKNLPYRLKIVGTGRDEKYLKCLASSNNNIEFLGHIDDHQLLILYQNCLGLIYPQEEDFGLTALEAQSCGRGVIAFNKGGAKETVIDGKTGILFPDQSVSSLLSAIEKYLHSPPSPQLCRQQSLKFDRRLFMLNFKKQVDILCHQKNISL